MGMNEMIQFFRQMSGKLGSSVYAGMQGQTNPQHISFLRQLQKETRGKNSLETPLMDLPVVIFDLETTGFHPERGDQIISIGGVKMSGAQIEEGPDSSFYSLVKPSVPVPKEIEQLTNIHEEQLESAPNTTDVLIDFFKFVNGRILVAHHANHEHSFMQKATWDLLRTRFEHRLLDTLFLIRLANPTVDTMTLDEACRQCCVDIKNRHNALGDAIMTAEVWSYYLNEANNKGIHNLKEVYEYLAKI